MNDRPFEQAAALCLREQGFLAELIEESNTPTPDILAADVSGQTYVLEIKERTVSWLEHAEPASKRLEVDVRTRADPTGPSSSIASIVKKAAKQLASVEM